MKSCDFLIIGGGVIGLQLALQLKRRHPDCSVVVLEKEDEVAFHASGRNSGVLHAGFYYTADSLKARFTRDGNRALAEYCEAHDLAINRCGKLVVAKNDSEHPVLDELLSRAARNGVELQPISEAEAREIEPRVKTSGRALWSPNTSCVDPKELLQAFAREAVEIGVEVMCGSRYEGSKGIANIYTNKGEISCGYLINAAGLHADKIAGDFGFSDKYRILPFKGLYLYSDEEPGAFRTNIYPVPNLKNPFLGVHFTVTVDGQAKIGPTAIPALWREQYTGFERFSANEFMEIAYRQMGLFFSADFDFRGLAWEEIKKNFRSYLVNESRCLASNLDVAHYKRWGRPGIRAQLLNIESRSLVMDFVFEFDDKSCHVLNAVSPALTCSMPFASHVLDACTKTGVSQNDLEAATG